MNLSHIIEALPLQVYVRRGELVIHFSTPADLINRFAETSAALADASRADGDRGGRRGASRLVGAGSNRSESDSELSVPDSESPGQAR